MLFGAGFEYKMGEKFALQPELLFIQKGGTESMDADGYVADADYTLNYLELPVLAKYNFGKFYVNAGPSFALGLGGKYKGEYSYQGVSNDFDGKIKFGDEPTNYEGDNIYFDNSIDIGVQLGGGVKAGPVLIDLRYGLGLTNLDDKPDGFSGDWKEQNRSWQLSVIYPIVLGN